MAHSVLRIPTTELSRHFGDYLARIRFGHDTVIVLKNNTPVAELRPLAGGECTIGSLFGLLGETPPDPEWATDVEAVNTADYPPENPWG